MTAVQILGGTYERVLVPEHETVRLTTTEGWVFSRVRTGCVRVQKGDFCAYLTDEESMAVSDFLYETAGGK